MISDYLDQINKDFKQYKLNINSKYIDKIKTELLKHNLELETSCKNGFDISFVCGLGRTSKGFGTIFELFGHTAILRYLKPLESNRKVSIWSVNLIREMLFLRFGDTGPISELDDIELDQQESSAIKVLRSGKLIIVDLDVLFL